MSSRFSRRSTRVQPKPKVCESPKPPSPPAEPTIPTLHVFVDVSYGPGMFAHNFVDEWTYHNDPAGTIHIENGLDSLGEPVQVTFAVGATPSTATITVNFQSTSDPPATTTSDTPGWDGTLPDSDSSLSWSNIQTGGSWTWNVN